MYPGFAAYCLPPDSLPIHSILAAFCLVISAAYCLILAAYRLTTHAAYCLISAAYRPHIAACRPQAL